MDHFSTNPMDLAFDSRNLSSSATVSEKTALEVQSQTGAALYVVAVILVYSLSIVMLIASVIRRKQSKKIVDREIVRYLQEFQTVKEISSRDSYRGLKKAIIDKLSKRELAGGAQRGLTDVAVPFSTVAVSWTDTELRSSDVPSYHQRTLIPSTTEINELTTTSSDFVCGAIAGRDLVPDATIFCRFCQFRNRRVLGDLKEEDDCNLLSSAAIRGNAYRQHVGTTSSQPPTPEPISVATFDPDGVIPLQVELSAMDGWRRKVFVEYDDTR